MPALWTILAFRRHTVFHGAGVKSGTSGCVQRASLRLRGWAEVSDEREQRELMAEDGLTCGRCCLPP